MRSFCTAVRKPCMANMVTGGKTPLLSPAELERLGYRLAVYPIVLGTGKKLFSDGFALAKLTLVETRALRSGVLVNTYRRSDVS